ncbi:phosphate ABC transporter permease PstA [Terasakiispira papahanaumokuakeensis]|nr:phosphate ABC transporter permease PstA [Terasakiispira papahanaumokuakeensis]
MRISMKDWVQSGSPWVWLNAGAVAISVIMVVGLLALIAVRGLAHFWPSDVVMTEVASVDGRPPLTLIGELVDQESVPASQLRSAGIKVPEGVEFADRWLIKVGNRQAFGSDFKWVLDQHMGPKRYPAHLLVMERREWGNFYGYLIGLKEKGRLIGEQPVGKNDLWPELERRIQRAVEIYDQIEQIEKVEIGAINYQIEQLRLKQKRLKLNDELTAEALDQLNAQRQTLKQRYETLQQQRNQLYQQLNRDSMIGQLSDGQQVEVKLGQVVRAYQPNAMGVGEKVSFYVQKIWEFLSDDPREANTEGGIFPAIYGTVLMVLLMSVLVTPFGVIAAVYLREYAKQGFITRLIRIAVNNLAGVPSIVYGVFGLGFFVYFLGGAIDTAFFPEAAPSPVFGTGGLMWASLTLALLTLPVVIVATEEGLSRIPRSVREGSLALGATKAETLWRVVLPMASPAMMTGLILAVARAAGEVAPLMLVGVVKLAPSLPLDGNAPFLHLDRKFMHLGFHIYDVGFQSPNVEAARPLVYATALLLVIVIGLLNVAAIAIRNRLREKYKALES